jgi:amino-acid N-acetyltransferase
MSDTDAASPVIKPADLRGILKYVPRFRGQIFVIAIDGQVVADENFPNLLLDIAVLRSLHIRVVIVHGIAHQLEQLSRTRGIPLTDVLGTGPSDAATLDLAVRASSRVSHEFFEGLAHAGLKCVLTNSVRASPLGVIKGVDHLHTGKVEKIDTEFLLKLIDDGVLPVIQPIGFDRDGKSLRINSDLLATELALDLSASKIIFLSTAPGLTHAGTIVREIAAEQLRALVGDGSSIEDPNLRSKAVNAARAIESGIPRVHIIDGRAHDALLNEIFSNEGVGTLVYGNDYQQIRRATKRDARTIYNLTRGAVKRDELLYRTLEKIEKNIENFFVYEIDENLIACVSLSGYPEAPGVLELGSLFVMPFYQKRGIGKRMVEFACHEAKRRGASRLFALSTQAFVFFNKVAGFAEGTKDDLPASRRALYDQSGRNSKVLIREITT